MFFERKKRPQPIVTEPIRVHDTRRFPHSLEKIDWEAINTIPPEILFARLEIFQKVVRNSALLEKLATDLHQKISLEEQDFLAEFLAFMLIFSGKSFGINTSDLLAVIISRTKNTRLLGSQSMQVAAPILIPNPQTERDSLIVRSSFGTVPIIKMHLSLYRKILTNLKKEAKIAQRPIENSYDQFLVDRQTQFSGHALGQFLITFFHEMYHVRQVFQDPAAANRSGLAAEDQELAYKQDWGERGARGYAFRAIAELRKFLINHPEFQHLKFVTPLIVGMTEYSDPEKIAQMILERDPWMPYVSTRPPITLIN